ncbi:Fe2+ transport system protein FeoA [Desulfohalotomaculum tongense]|uniref:FeoA family protein n=1 Tax=Desulforadius tongensis TaxID=1216062 RepID=UPI00195C1BF4|nr:FeoA family protein [Desulforadius tongensis]MBM7854901.1 Fe2+ transport system protein FeoA [Desulforadius tongensis]
MSAKDSVVLSDMKPGSRGKVVRISAKGPLRRRILDMGLVSGVEINVKGVAPLGDPMEILVRGYSLSLRKQEAAEIHVEVM